MPISEFLASVIACPAPDHGSLSEGADSSGAPTLTCQSCGRVYPIRNGIPVLLLAEATYSREPGE